DLNSFFVKVEGSTFVMGDASTNIGEHKVGLDTFYMMDTEVPQWLYTEIMGNNPSNYQIADNPVEMVDWYDAVEFCNRLSEKNGLTPCYSLKGKTAVKKWGKKSAKWNDINCDFSANGYRLPTEAEWEYAARGGKSLRNYIYSGSDIIDNVAWTTDNSDFTHSVGLKQANVLGIYDMTGNVAEWCWDWHGSYTSEAQVNPKGPETGENKIVRGGGYSFKLYTNNLYFRLYSSIKGNKAIGIRLVRSRL
ncbi:MAG: SUMF1/EgtB/PvdO family nonheme iron enzyme, partial [Treponema sp.]|nr:SUMF1/EgtB/PvdO family nonheme iron enzyme [Treponema sp.]